MSLPTASVTQLTSGLYSNDQVNTIITIGMPVVPTSASATTAFSIPTTADLANASGLLSTLGIGPVLYNVPTSTYDPTLGNLSSYLNPAGSITSAVSAGGVVTYSGSDIHALIELPQTSTTPRLYKELIELTTLSISVHRVKTPARALGYIGPKGYARGTRTIAGTMIFTKFTLDVLAEFLQTGVTSDLSKDSQYKKIDQLPPFNMTLLFANEYGYVSYQRLLGIDFIDDGSVYASQDAYSESTASYVASDFTPLLPYTTGALNTLPQLPNVNAQPTPGSVLQSQTPPNNSISPSSGSIPGTILV
jgi:hypothetical protein